MGPGPGRPPRRELDARAAAAPTRPLADVVIHLRLLEADEGLLDGDGWRDDHSQAHFRAAYEALERLAGGGG